MRKLSSRNSWEFPHENDNIKVLAHAKGNEIDIRLKGVLLSCMDYIEFKCLITNLNIKKIIIDEYGE